MIGLDSHDSRVRGCESRVRFFSSPRNVNVNQWVSFFFIASCNERWKMRGDRLGELSGNSVLVHSRAAERSQLLQQSFALFVWEHTGKQCKVVRLVVNDEDFPTNWSQRHKNQLGKAGSKKLLLIGMHYFKSEASSHTTPQHSSRNKIADIKIKGLESLEICCFVTLVL